MNEVKPKKLSFISCSKGRHSAMHNCRNFEVEADHIDKSLSYKNVYWSWDGDKDFVRSEQKFYEKHFQAALDKQNAKYTAPSQRKYRNTMEQWRKSNAKHGITEIIIQAGNRDNQEKDELSLQVLHECVRYLMRIGEDSNKRFNVLNYAIHMDEASPHAHISTVLAYYDEEGILCV